VQELQEPYTMPSFVGFGAHPTQQSFDLIFVDGIDTLRRPFAIHTWPLLVAGGVMLFHDTRRSQDVANVLAVCAEFHSEVGAVSFNEDESSTSIIYKRTPLQYVNWNLVEGKPHWMYGGDHSKGLRDLP
jgi:hypothetical protein